MEFIIEFKDVLSQDICDHIIQKFEKDERKIKGKTTSGIDIKYKSSSDLYITPLDDWCDIDKHIHEVLSKYLEKYIYSIGSYYVQTFDDCRDSGYHIQHYKKGDYYKWHEDSYYSTIDRKLSCIFYLNTLDENDGGSTLFSCGKRIHPTRGSLLIFPSSWTYFHCGEEVYNHEKYIITTFIISDSHVV
uniref:Fe2OG dioxygenase domain-containing protein n=1 Tax=viral metagenome TaxID=1070528 RepID=A0A6C0JX85_9ZZZZ